MSPPASETQTHRQDDDGARLIGRQCINLQEDGAFDWPGTFDWPTMHQFSKQQQNIYLLPHSSTQVAVVSEDKFKVQVAYDSFGG